MKKKKSNRTLIVFFAHIIWDNPGKSDAYIAWLSLFYLNTLMNNVFLSVCDKAYKQTFQLVPHETKSP